MDFGFRVKGGVKSLQFARFGDVEEVRIPSRQAVRLTSGALKPRAKSRSCWVTRQANMPTHAIPEHAFLPAPQILCSPVAPHTI